MQALNYEVIDTIGIPELLDILSQSIQTIQQSKRLTDQEQRARAEQTLREQIMKIVQLLNSQRQFAIQEAEQEKQRNREDLKFAFHELELLRLEFEEITEAHNMNNQDMQQTIDSINNDKLPKSEEEQKQEEQELEFQARLKRFRKEEQELDGRMKSLQYDLSEVNGQIADYRENEIQQSRKSSSSSSEEEKEQASPVQTFLIDASKLKDEILHKEVTLPKHQKEMSTIAQTRSGDYILGGMCGSFIVVNNQFIIKKQVCLKEQISSCFSFRQKVYFGLSNETIKVFDESTYEEIATIKSKGTTYSFIVINKSSIGAAGYEGNFQIIDYKENTVLFNYKFPSTILDMIKIKSSSKTNEYAVCTEGNGLIFINLTQKQKSYFIRNTDSYFGSKSIQSVMQIKNTNKYLIAINGNKNLQIFDRENKKTFKEIQTQSQKISCIQQLICNGQEENQEFVLVKDEKCIHIISLNTFDIIAKIPFKYVGWARKYSLFQSINNNRELRIIYFDQQYDQRRVVIKSIPLLL